MDLSSQDQSTWVCASIVVLANDVLPEPNGSWYLCILQWAQGMCPNLVDADWARHVVGVLARAWVQKANPSLSSHISIAPTKNTLCDSTAVHAQHCRLCAHVQTSLASYLNKIRQT